MTPFLKQVADHYRNCGNPEKICFIFPNRRAKAFFKEHLRDAVAKSGNGPVVAPAMMTMNEFFYAVSEADTTPRIKLLLELHSHYSRLNKRAESLDDFIFWGDVLLSDFDDIDKYLVNPEHILTNVSDFKKISGEYSWLSPTQAEAIKRFLGHFSAEAVSGIDGDGNDNYKVKFLRIWDILLPLYRDFNASLSEKGMSYEGKVYRETVTRLETEAAVDMLSRAFDGIEKYVFVGLNALNECEKKLMGKMRDAGIAEFCWDWCSPMIKAPENKSSLFLSENVVRFPQAFEPETREGGTSFKVLSVPGATGQAKRLPDILRSIGQEQGGVPGIETAIVLPDEVQLLPVLNSIPPEIEKVNVTMGYPMNACEFWALATEAASLQLHMRLKDGKWHFYHKQVWNILSNSLFKSTTGEEGVKLSERIRKASQYYIPVEELQDGGVASLIFTPVATKPGEADADQNDAIASYLQKMTAGIAARLRDIQDMGLEIEFAKEYYNSLGQLRDCRLPITPASFFRLVTQLCSGATVPFHGEPLKGLQIMGPLETRALDFENVVIMSCNEGMFPRRSVSSSFIPAELRKGFGLPTYEHQDAVWAYYFYRLIQRAGTVWMIYDSRTEGLNGGEESRYIKQLEMHFGANVERYIAKAGISGGVTEPFIVKKSEDIEELRKNGHLSASALQNYLNCPAKFYYANIRKLKEDKGVMESLDASMLGTALHETMKRVYKNKREIGTGYLKELLENEEKIRDTVAEEIRKQLKYPEITGRNIIFLDIITKYVVCILNRDLKLLEGKGLESFRIEGLELPLNAKFHEFNFVGIIDRLDSFSPGSIRVVDYKTGRVEDDDFIINDGNAEKVAAAVFGPDNKKRPKIALQIYLYDRIIEQNGLVKGRSVNNSIYQTSRLFVKDVEEIALCDKFTSLMDKGLENLLSEIANTDIPWTRKGLADKETCKYCEFKTLCGK